MNKSDNFLIIIIILELFVLGAIINEKIRPNYIYITPITDVVDICLYIDDLDIAYFNRTENIIYTRSCLDFSNHTYQFYLNNELQYTFSNRSLILDLPFNISTEDFPIELRVIDLTINRTIAIEIMYKWKY
jgi:hypothetical protein